jgi:hypothetical protein
MDTRPEDTQNPPNGGPGTNQQAGANAAGAAGPAAQAGGPDAAPQAVAMNAPQPGEGAQPPAGPEPAAVPVQAPAIPPVQAAAPEAPAVPEANPNLARAGGAGGGNGGGGGQPGGGGNGGPGGGGGGARVINLGDIGESHVEVAPVEARTPTPAAMSTGKRLTTWVLMIAAGSIVLLVFYLWRMDLTAGDDIRRNYGKDLNREDISLYLAQRLENFSDALKRAGEDQAFAIPKRTAEDETALIETLTLFPSVLISEDRSKLDGCVGLISVPGSDRKAKLDPCIKILDTVRSQGVTAASAAFSYQLAAEASEKLLEQRNSLHDFWLKAAQLILLNLLLPVLTAVIGYTFGSQQGQQQAQQQGQ